MTQQSAFPAPRSAEDDENFPFEHVEAHAVEDRRVPVTDHEVFDLNDGFSFHFFHWTCLKKILRKPTETGHHKNSKYAFLRRDSL